MSNLFDVKGKRIVVTGGSGVLCSELVRFFAARGAIVCIGDYKLDRAAGFAKEITDAGGVAYPLKMNVVVKEEVENSLDKAIELMGGVDVLINGAGGNKKEATATDELSFFDIPADAFRWVFDLNLIGALLPSQVYGKYMAEQKKGIILNVSSMNAYKPLTKIVAYSAAKAAVSNFTQWLAVHMCQKYSTDIRVNAIAPGFFLTDQNRFLLTDEKTGDLTPRGRQIIDHTPMGRFGDADEICGTVQWLISDASKFVNGTVIPIDGGFSAFSGV